MPKWTVLIATSESQYMEESMRAMRESDVAVLTADSYADALRVIESNKIDLMLADLDMQGGGEGDALCRRLRESADAQRAYVILLCGGKRAELRRCGLCGADAYIKLPLNTNTIAQRIITTLELPRKRATRVLVKVSVISTFKSEPFYCTSHDISETGMMLESEKTLAMNDEISCSFFLPDLDRITVNCKVARLGKPAEGIHNYGVEFMSLDDSQTQILRAFIEQQRIEGNFK